MVDSFLFYTSNTKISLLEYFLSFLISTNVIAYLFFLLNPQISRLSLYSKTKNISYKFYDFCIWNIQNKDLSLKFICIKSILFVPKNSNFSLRQVFELLNLFILPWFYSNLNKSKNTNTHIRLWTLFFDESL
jgi:hypothetical protein